MCFCCIFFFFQAEDGIRDRDVTGVQTCALPICQAFAIRNCDAFFLQASRTSLDETAQKVATAKDQAKQQGRELGVYTVGVVTCRPSKKEAEEYFHYSIVERADGRAVDDIFALKNICAQIAPAEK